MYCTSTIITITAKKYGKNINELVLYTSKPNCCKIKKSGSKPQPALYCINGKTNKVPFTYLTT